MPAQLYRIQRRDFFRLSLFPSERLSCVIPVNEPEWSGELEVPVMNISGGGVRLFYQDNRIEFVPGQVYEGCRIDLPEVGQLAVTLEIKNQMAVTVRNGQVNQRIGCEFKDVDKAAGFLLQRYVTRVQRERAAA
jgi:c-di-GMP-binding flagellar brake protein YcgR